MIQTIAITGTVDTLTVALNTALRELQTNGHVVTNISDPVLGGDVLLVLIVYRAAPAAS